MSQNTTAEPSPCFIEIFDRGLLKLKFANCVKIEDTDKASILVFLLFLGMDD